MYEVIVETCIEINLVASYAGRTGSRQLRNRRLGFNSTQGHSDHPTLHSPTSLECSLSVVLVVRGAGGRGGQLEGAGVSQSAASWSGPGHPTDRAACWDAPILEQCLG